MSACPGSRSERSRSFGPSGPTAVLDGLYAGQWGELDATDTPYPWHGPVPESGPTPTKTFSCSLRGYRAASRCRPRSGRLAVAETTFQKTSTRDIIRFRLSSMPFPFTINPEARKAAFQERPHVKRIRTSHRLAGWSTTSNPMAISIRNPEPPQIPYSVSRSEPAEITRDRPLQRGRHADRSAATDAMDSNVKRCRTAKPPQT